MELVFIAVGAILLLVLISMASKKTRGLNRKYYSQKWTEVKATLSAGEAGPRMAVIDADKLMSKALEQSGYSGTNFAERMRSAEGAIKNYQAVWDAHKLRNRVVHEDVNLKKKQAVKAVNSFQGGLKSLGAL